MAIHEKAAPAPDTLQEPLEALRELKPPKGEEVKLDATLTRDGKRIVHVVLVRCVAVRKSRPEIMRETGAAVARYARKHALKRVAILAGKGQDMAQSAEALVTGFLLASLKYEEYRSGESDEAATDLQIICEQRVSDAIERGQIIADAQNFARTIATRPGNDINPVTLAGLCQSAARDAGLRCRVLDEKQCARLQMGGLLGVGMGAQATPPRLIVLEYLPRGIKGAPVLLVGKSITFDTGGISIKPAEKMGRMVFDKCGGMAVLGAMVAAARLKLRVPVVGILSAAENHISERSFRPGDILRMFNGLTVEVTNTDAEGRLVLADAISWGIKTYKPAACIDVATLTGGVIVALGRTVAGIMGNDQRLIDSLRDVGKSQGEKMWQLPLPEEPRQMLKSNVADMVNSAGRDAHPLQGAAFLSQYLDKEAKMPWAHLDIAGADTERESALYSAGATGWGVRTLVHWLMERR